MRTSRSDVQLELRIDGLACRHPAHGRRSAGRSLLAVRCSTNSTAASLTTWLACLTSTSPARRGTEFAIALATASAIHT